MNDGLMHLREVDADAVAERKDSTSVCVCEELLSKIGCELAGVGSRIFQARCGGW
jgi:hypothetical protein